MIGLVVAGTFASVAGAQPSAGSAGQLAPTRTLSLPEAVGAALRGNASLRIAARSIDAAHGLAVGASGVFDPAVQTSAQQSRTGVAVATSATEFASLITSQTTYSVATPTTLRNGTTITPQLAVVRSDLSTAPGASTSRATAALTATVPLWQDRGGSVTRATQMAAERAESATVAGAKHTAAQVAQNTALSYWSFVAANERLAVYVASEDRAERLVEQTAALVRADERPMSDLVQVRASLVTKRTIRINAEQTMRDVWRQLATVMGDATVLAADPPAPSSAFPSASPERIAAAPEAFATALRRRADLASAEANERSAGLQDRLAEQTVRPRLDISASIGYAGVDRGWGIDHFFGPLVRSQGGMNASLQLEYRGSFANTRARGSLLAADAAYEQRRIATEDLRRQIALGVANASDGVVRARAALDVADSAVTLSLESVKNVQQRFQLSVNTVLDLLSAEDVLTTARLAQITARNSYAAARINLAFESGTLFDRTGTGPDANPVGGVTPP